MSSMILDWSWFVFRAYYAIPELHDREGHNVNAVFGFFRMLLKLLDNKPKHFVIARDSPVKTIRKEQFLTYKANRTKMPDEFKRQMSMIHQIATEIGVPALQAPGYEADDIIATLALNSVDKVDEVRIVSSDKDIKQLLQPWIVVYDPGKDILSDHLSFAVEYWFTPEQYLDYLSLIGDSSDNVPGVSGIWPKTALDLIKRFWSLDGIYANLDSIASWTAEKLRVGQLQGQESKSLITLMKVPELLNNTLQEFSREPDFVRISSILVDQYHLHSLAGLIQTLKKQRQWGEQLSLFG
jgi:DNA polymerase I